MQHYDHDPNLIQIELLGRKWAIERPASLDELWNKLAEDEPVAEPEILRKLHFQNINMDKLVRAFEEDDRIPYWTEIWPAGIALSEWIVSKKTAIAGKLCLDLGCGLGFSTTVGAFCGAKVVGMDYEPAALYYAALNSRNNLKPQMGANSKNICFVAADWRKPTFKRAAFDLIWAGDIMYERRFMNPVAEFVNYCLDPAGKLWVAEPGRGIYPEFACKMQDGGWRAEIVERLKARLPESEAKPADIQIWELSRKSI